jgi:hypothetical protein
MESKDYNLMEVEDLFNSLEVTLISTYEALDVMLNFGIFIFAMLAFITSVIFFINAKKR